MSSKRARLALAENPLETFFGAEEPTPPSASTTDPGPQPVTIDETSESNQKVKTQAAQPATQGDSKDETVEVPEPEPEPKRKGSREVRAKTREPQVTQVSASRAYRIGTQLDPYRRADGKLVRPLRLTLPIDLIESIQVLAIRRGRKPTALVQELIEHFVREHHAEL